VSVLLLAPAAWLIYRYVGLPPAFAKDEIGILVAEVPDQPNREQQTAYQNAIIDRIRGIQQLRDVVKVRLIERPLPFDLVEQQTEALKIGRWLGASFVLRPFSVEGMQEPRLTVVNNPYFSNSESRIGGKFQNAQLANLDQLSLPRDLALLAETSLALAFDERQSYAEAAQILGDVLKSPKLPDVAPSRSELNLICADDLYYSGNAIEAIAEYKEAIRLKPNFPEAHINLGYAFEYEGQYDAAIAEYRVAIRLKPNFVLAHYNLGNTLDHKGQYDAAITEYREAVRLAPDFAAAHTNLVTPLTKRASTTPRSPSTGRPSGSNPTSRRPILT
jgi:tetratricopeptide (TPR) repeat protein